MGSIQFLNAVCKTLDRTELSDSNRNSHLFLFTFTLPIEVNRCLYAYVFTLTYDAMNIRTFVLCPSHMIRICSSQVVYSTDSFTLTDGRLVVCVTSNGAFTVAKRMEGNRFDK